MMSKARDDALIEEWIRADDALAAEAGRIQVWITDRLPDWRMYWDDSGRATFTVRRELPDARLATVRLSKREAGWVTSAAELQLAYDTLDEWMDYLRR
jgi:hypothetical protein